MRGLKMMKQLRYRTHALAAACAAAFEKLRRLLPRSMAVRTEESIVRRHEVIVIPAPATATVRANQVSVLRTRTEDPIASSTGDIDADDHAFKHRRLFRSNRFSQLSRIRDMNFAGRLFRLVSDRLGIDTRSRFWNFGNLQIGFAVRATRQSINNLLTISMDKGLTRGA